MVFSIKSRKTEIIKEKIPKKSEIPIKIGKKKIICTSILMVLGLCTLSSSFFLGNIINIKINEAIADQVTVPDPSDEDYDSWVSNNYKDAIPSFSNYYLWNLTNLKDFLAGCTPIYQEIGPYVFREYNTKFNIKFNDDKTKVSYNSYSSYEFDSEKSEGLNLFDKITNINPGYLGVLNMTKTEKNLVGLMAPTVLSTIKNSFMEGFDKSMNDQSTWDGIRSQVDVNFRQGVAEMLASQSANAAKTSESEIVRIVNTIVERIRANMPNSLDAFVSEWSLGRFPDIANEIFAGINIKIDLQTWIQVVTTVLIWILAFIFPFLIGIAVVSTVLVWNTYSFPCNLENEGIGDMVEQNAHDMIIDELNFDQAFIESLDANSLNPNDLSFKLNYGSTNDLYSDAKIPLSKSKILWNQNDNFSLIGAEGAKWFDAASGTLESINFLKQRYSLTDAEISGTFSWLDGAATSWLSNICGYLVQNMTSGLVTTRTVEEWLFTAKDNLIMNVDPTLASVNLFNNCDNETEAEQIKTNRITLNTGKDDYTKAKNIVEFNGEEELKVWTEPIQVEGSDGTYFKPGVSMDDNLKVFVPDLLRTTEFKYDKPVNVYDIDLLRFKFADETFEPNQIYDMDIEGLANLFPSYGLPVYLSKPHFLDADSSIQDAVIGMHPDAKKHDTYIDVEPITGITMRARPRMQINFKVNPTDLWYSNVSEAYIPVLWVEQETEITEEKAIEFKNSLYEAIVLRNTLTQSLLGIGFAIALLGGFTTRTLKIRRNKRIVQLNPLKQDEKLRKHSKKNFK